MVAGVMLTSFSNGHDTTCATSDLLDEGIDDTFVSVVAAIGPSRYVGLADTFV
jgi:hypothetical protein